jgi:hypothetical protein
MIQELIFDGRLVPGIRYLQSGISPLAGRFPTPDWMAVTGPAQKLPPTTYAAAMMALLGILLVGLFLVTATLLGGHWVRRLGKHRRGPCVPPDMAPLRQPNKASPADASLHVQSSRASEVDTMIGIDETQTSEDTRADT